MYHLDFNLSHEYYEVHGLIVLKNKVLSKKSYDKFGMQTPLYDIFELLDMIRKLLGENILDYPTGSLSRELTQKQFDVRFD